MTNVVSRPFAFAQYASLVRESSKMADALQASCSAPLFKRPRLDFSTQDVVSESPFDSLMSNTSFRSVSELRRSSSEVTSSPDSQMDVNGGDSGFHDSLPPISGIDSPFSATDTVNHLQHTGNEADNSSTSLDEQIRNGTANKPPDKDYDDSDGDEVASTVSELSGLSDLSNFSSPDSKQALGPYTWVRGIDPREVLTELLPSNTVIPPNLSSSVLWRLVLSVLSEPPSRSKLPHVNTMVDAITLIRNCKKIVVLTGAGVSVSCGIPDFRSRNGVYARLSQDYPDLPDPQAMFDIHYFRRDPRPFFKFAKEIYPGLFQPSPSHHFIRLIEKQGKLLHNYTQNIDTLEHLAGIEKVITCHGSFATATCTVCRYSVDSSVIKEDIFDQRIPYCPVCSSDLEERGIMKPDIVFFGEGLSEEFHDCMAKDKEECDLLIVMGSSLKVRPVALIPNSLPPNVPQILINREPLKHLDFDVELLGDCDIIVAELCRRLGDDWNIGDQEHKPLKEITSLPHPRTSFYQIHTEKSSAMSTPSSCSPNLTRRSGAQEASSAFDPAKTASSSVPTVEEESNSCDCRGMSAIKLDDSQDCSSSGLPSNNQSPLNRNNEPNPDIGIRNFDVWSYQAMEPLSASLPEDTYLFVAPNRYIFPGAEVYPDVSAEPPTSISTSPYHAAAPSESSSLSSDEDDDEEEEEVVLVPEREKVSDHSHGDDDNAVHSIDEDPGCDADTQSSMPVNSEHSNTKKDKTS